MKRSLSSAKLPARGSTLATLLALAVVACTRTPETALETAREASPESAAFPAAFSKPTTPAWAADSSTAASAVAPGSSNLSIDDLTTSPVLLTPGFEGAVPSASPGQLSASVHVATALIAQITDPVLTLQTHCTGIDNSSTWTSPSSTLHLTSPPTSNRLASSDEGRASDQSPSLPPAARQGSNQGLTTVAVSVIWPDGAADGMTSSSSDYLSSRQYECTLEARVSSSAHLRLTRAKVSSSPVNWNVQVASIATVSPSTYGNDDHVTQTLPVTLSDGSAIPIPLAVYEGTVQSTDDVPDLTGTVHLSAVAPSTVEVGSAGELAMPLNPVVMLGPESSTFSTPVIVGLPLENPTGNPASESLEPSFYSQTEARWIRCDESDTTGCRATDCPADFPPGLACVATTHFSAWTFGAKYVTLTFALASGTPATPWNCQSGTHCPENLQFSDGDSWTKAYSLVASSTAPVGYAQLLDCGGAPCGSKGASPKIVPTTGIAASAACDPLSNVLKTGASAACPFQNYNPKADSAKQGWNVGFVGLTSPGLDSPGWGSERMSLSLGDVYCAVWALEYGSRTCVPPATLAASGTSSQCPNNPQTQGATSQTNLHGTLFACLNLEIQPSVSTAEISSNSAPLLTLVTDAGTMLTSDPTDVVKFAWADLNQATSPGWKPAESELTGPMTVGLDADSATWPYESAPATQGINQARVYVQTVKYGNVLGPAVTVLGINDDGDGSSVGDGDCDDEVDSIHPYAVELPADGTDNNCNGRVDEVMAVIAGGFTHSLMADSLGHVWAAGDNEYGQLGDGTVTDSSVPVQVEGLSGIVAVAAGSQHSLALDRQGRVWAWGSNEYGQLGDGTRTDSSIPLQVPGLSAIVAIASGGRHSLALDSQGRVWAWGLNLYSQLGNGSNTDSSIPLQVPGLSGIVAISSKQSHCLALDSLGQVWAWGYNGYGQLGNGTKTSSSIPIQVTTLSGIVAIDAGGLHSVARDSQGQVWAWGYNYYGQLGNGSTTNSSVPVQVTGLTDVEIVAFAASGRHTMALDSAGGLWAWGFNGYGQLGNGETTNSSTPLLVTRLSRLAAVSSGWDHSLALGSDGGLWAWGDTQYDLLGNGRTTSSSLPAGVSGSHELKIVATGAEHSLALDSQGKLWAWGYNIYGQFGNGTTSESNVPMQVAGLGGIEIVAIAAGGYHSLALDSQGRVWTWGYNKDGQLGTGTTTNSLVPAQVTGLNGIPIAAIAAGYYHSLALDSQGRVWAWGNNTYGQLGNGSHTSSSTPAQVASVSGISSMAAGALHSLALDSEGRVWTWGHNYFGQLGNGTTTDSSLPAQASGLNGMEVITAGANHSLALDSLGQVWAWGDNYFGELGDGTHTDSSTPILNTSLSGIVAVAGGQGHSFVLDTQGRLWAWGYNTFGQLGDGSTTSSSHPIKVSGFTGPTGVTRGEGQRYLAAGDYFSLAIRSDGAGAGWGAHSYGQLDGGYSVLIPRLSLFIRDIQ